MKTLSIFEKPIRIEAVSVALNFIRQNNDVHVVQKLRREESNTLSSHANPIIKKLYEEEEGHNFRNWIGYFLSPQFAAAAKIACIKQLPLPMDSYLIKYCNEWIEKNV